jgi:hypothetical protein
MSCSRPRRSVFSARAAALFARLNDRKAATADAKAAIAEQMAATVSGPTLKTRV